MRRLKTIPIIDDNRAASYTISALIMTTITITLVVAASFYALQVLDQQRGSAEYQATVKSILAFDDALENVAWKANGTLSSRFTVQYGELRIYPEKSALGNVIKIYGLVGGNSPLLYSNKSCVLSYYLSNRYVTYGDLYKSYILGDPSALLVSSQGTYGRAVVMQHAGWVNVTLDTRVRAMLTSKIYVTKYTNYVNYVDIWVIRTLVHPSLQNYGYYSYLHDFDLKARSLSVRSTPMGMYYVPLDGNVRLNVTVGGTMTSPPVTLNITPGQYVLFNVIVGTVQVWA